MGNSSVGHPVEARERVMETTITENILCDGTISMLKYDVLLRKICYNEKVL